MHGSCSDGLHCVSLIPIRCTRTYTLIVGFVNVISEQRLMVAANKLIRKTLKQKRMVVDVMKAVEAMTLL
jgi:hypothetical protein